VTDSDSPAVARSLPSFTPFFDWVQEMTHDPSTTLTYGLVWRFAQRRNHCCYASCESMARILGRTRHSIMRHLRTLVSLGLIVCADPEATGVPHTYLPVLQNGTVTERTM
jgi:hypothetical protein